MDNKDKMTAIVNRELGKIKDENHACELMFSLGYDSAYKNLNSFQIEVNWELFVELFFRFNDYENLSESHRKGVMKGKEAIASLNNERSE